MTEKCPQEARVDAILAQDATVSSFQFEEFRMNLEVSIQRLEQRARTIRRASLWGLGILITCVVSVIPIEMFGISRYEWVYPIWSGCGLVAMVSTGVLTCIYSYKYRPALKRKRCDLQSMMIAQLQQQVAELSSRLDG